MKPDAHHTGHATISEMEWSTFPSRREMGEASARAAAEALRSAIQREGRVAVIFASAVSQNEFLDALAADKSIDWSRVTAFHMDEYIGIASGHPASFRRFLNERLWSRVTPSVFHELQGDSPDIDTEIERYSDLLDRERPSIVFAGIGENGHLAFNDPPVDFNDSQAVRVVHLDEVCRMQQVHDGAFAHIMDVPPTALTLTVPALMRAQKIVLNVPGRNKAEAVRRTVEGLVTPECPASILQQHANAALYLDTDSACLLQQPSGTTSDKQRVDGTAGAGEELGPVGEDSRPTRSSGSPAL
ncbi:MAG TPA: glucosamine-6-phosphate deaminase [Bryobacteraceae bacterium]|nr:glucosamine-6-phosphate deaminase [Bryobacteraceae bacterium]